MNTFPASNRLLRVARRRLVSFLLGCALTTTTALAIDTPQPSSDSAAVHQAGAQLGDSAPPADAAIADLCRDISSKLGSISMERCHAAQLSASEGRSVGGRALAYREFVPEGLTLDTPRILLFGGIHGDEFSSMSIVFTWLEFLESQGPAAYHWRVYPVLNPDGLLAGERVNAAGVDLNRNFPTPNWRETTQEYWSGRTGKDPRRYPGSEPLSEPESEWILREIHLFEPTVIISVHAPYNVLDFDGPPQSAPQQIGPLRLRLLGTYPGSLGRYAGLVRQKPVVTLELSSAGILPSSTEQQQMWSDLLYWLKERFPSPAASTEQQ